MGETRADFTMTFRCLSELTLKEQNDQESSNHCWALADLSRHKRWKDWLAHYHLRLSQYVEHISMLTN